jgi:magnesium-transporting ATPase (P-type)
MFCDKTGTLTKNELQFRGIADSACSLEQAYEGKSMMDLAGYHMTR